MAGKLVGAAGHFGRQMRKERLAHGWSLPEFSARIGFDAGHLSRVENAKRPPTEALAKGVRRGVSGASWVLGSAADVVR